QGRFAQVISAIQPLVNSNRLDPSDLGNASILIGVAYDAVANYSAAQRAFDRALGLFEHDPQHVTEYAAALQNYSQLYTDMGQLDAAETMCHKALEIQQQAGDRIAAGRSSIQLAGLAIARSDIRSARRYLNDARALLKLTSDVIGDDFVILSE